MDTFKAGLSKTLFWLLTLSVGAGLACSKSSATLQSSSNKNSEPAASAGTNQAHEDAEKMFADFFVEGDSLSYNGYEVVKLKRWMNEANEKQTHLEPCAVLTRKGRPVTTFEGITHGGLAAIDFGLASLLGPEAKQLVVSQTRPRGGRHWVVDLSDGTILFDSFEYAVGREDGWIKDVDRDGISEIIFELPAFYMFEAMSPSVTPLPEIIFRYDTNTRKYLPANALLRFGLEGIDKAIEDLDSTPTAEARSEGGYVSARLDILLRYVFAGKENEGWAFFEEHYRLDDRQEIKLKIEAVLATEPINKLI